MKTMTPEQKLKYAILVQYSEMNDAERPSYSAESIDDLYDSTMDVYADLYDAVEEVRCGGEETDIPAEFSRHYESESRAMQMPDGSWVGWTYWYGGGKHGDPGSMPWMEYAYDLDVQEEERVMIVRNFTKKS